MMMNSVAPVWDGNETWLVLGGGGLFAVFPLAYAMIMPALYAPHHRHAAGADVPRRGVRVPLPRTVARRALLWDCAFCRRLASSPRFAQGMALGALLQGIPVVDRAYAGGWWDWLTRFSLLCGMAVVIGYALQASCWLIWRTEGGLQRRCRRYAWRARPAPCCLLTIVVSLWTPMLDPSFYQRWFQLARDCC